MKPVDPSAPAPPLAPKTEASDELKVALEQRLWQLLYNPPVASTADNPEQAAQLIAAQALGEAGGSAQTDVPARDERERERDASGALASAAHLLAVTIPQLGVMRYEHASARPMALENGIVQLGYVDADGGTASVSVMHPLLGDIALDVELSQGAVRVVATVPNDYGARILLEGQALLAERLRRQGTTLQALEVLVRRKRKDKEPQPTRKRQRRQERSP